MKIFQILTAHDLSSHHLVPFTMPSVCRHAPSNDGCSTLCNSKQNRPINCLGHSVFSKQQKSNLCPMSFISSPQRIFNINYNLLSRSTLPLSAY